LRSNILSGDSKSNTFDFTKIEADTEVKVLDNLEKYK
jgi:hypothetical protein